MVRLLYIHPIESDTFSVFFYSYLSEMGRKGWPLTISPPIGEKTQEMEGKPLQAVFRVLL